MKQTLSSIWAHKELFIYFLLLFPDQIPFFDERGTDDHKLFRWLSNSYAFGLYFFLEWFQKLRKWWTLCRIQTPAWLHHIVAVKRKTILFSHTSELNNCGRPGYLFHSRLFTFHLGIHPAWLKFFLLSEILLFPFRQDQNTAFYLERKDKEFSLCKWFNRQLVSVRRLMMIITQ